VVIVNVVLGIPEKMDTY